MMKNSMIGFISVNLLYGLIWFFTMKMKKSSRFQEMDNGYEFACTLSETERQQYEKEDRKLVHLFFALTFVLMNLTLFLALNKNSAWMIVLPVGLVASSVFIMIAGFRLQKKFRPPQKKDEIAE